MDIPKAEQRVLHLRAQGSCILVKKKNEDGRIVNFETLTRDGWYWGGCSMRLFRKLKYKRLIASSSGGPYKVTRPGLRRVRSQADNRQKGIFPPTPKCAPSSRRACFQRLAFGLTRSALSSPSASL
ncbi:hypothetical protein DCO57_15140 [Labrenzia sp. 011]|nr:hypothetical protein DCO57_15140 [Labrenzia sp. 011]